MLLPRAPALHSLLPTPAAALWCHPSCCAPPLCHGRVPPQLAVRGPRRSSGAHNQTREGVSSTSTPPFPPTRPLSCLSLPLGLHMSQIRTPTLYGVTGREPRHCGWPGWASWCPEGVCCWWGPRAGRITATALSWQLPTLASAKRGMAFLRWPRDSWRGGSEERVPVLSGQEVLA